MGAAGLTKKRSLQRFFPNFNPMDWQQIPTEQIPNQTRFGQYKTFKNKLTNQWIDRYVLNFYSDKEQKIYQECFMQRLRQEYLVNAFHYQPLKNSGFCSNSRGAIVYIQHIPVRLCDITDVPFEQSLYIMKSALYGFQKLFNQSGYFQISDEHIGIDKQGHVRVWLNSDLSKNYPFSMDDQTHQSKDYQKNMVNEIIKVIQQNTNFKQFNENDLQQGKQFIPITTQMQRNNTNHPSFRQAQEIIRQYILKYRIALPRKCGSVIEIIESEYGQHFNISNESDFSEKLKMGDQFHQRSSIGNNSRQSLDRIKINSSRNNLLQQNINQPLDFLNSNSVFNQNGRDLLEKQKNAVPVKYQYQPLFNYIVNTTAVKKDSGADSSQSNLDQYKQIRIQSRNSRQIGSQNNQFHSSRYNTNRSDTSSNQRQQAVLEIIPSNQMSSRIQASTMSRKSTLRSNMEINNSSFVTSNIPKITFSYMSNPQQNYQAFIKKNKIYNRQIIGLSKIQSNPSQSSLISDLQHKNRIYSEKNRNQQNISLNHNNSSRYYKRNQQFRIDSKISQGYRIEQNISPQKNQEQKSIQQRIIDIQASESIDPEIMRDLLKQFPETSAEIL